MKKILIIAVLFGFGRCAVQITPADIKSCVTFYTQGTKINCQGTLTVLDKKEYCENIKSADLCQDVESCFVNNYAALNRFEGTADCAAKAYTKGCGEGVFVAADSTCP